MDYNFHFDQFDPFFWSFEKARTKRIGLPSRRKDWGDFHFTLRLITLAMIIWKKLSFLNDVYCDLKFRTVEALIKNNHDNETILINMCSILTWWVCFWVDQSFWRGREHFLTCYLWEASVLPGEWAWWPWSACWGFRLIHILPKVCTITCWLISSNSTLGLIENVQIVNGDDDNIKDCKDL